MSIYICKKCGQTSFVELLGDLCYECQKPAQQKFKPSDKVRVRIMADADVSYTDEDIITYEQYLEWQEDLGDFSDWFSVSDSDWSVTIEILEKVDA